MICPAIKKSRARANFFALARFTGEAGIDFRSDYQIVFSCFPVILLGISL
ncbi:hypothetical protein PRUB_a0584 [Pseudoalteromonas rubra]|uniref:Uncharacterized protein n=1 Tax=Pseudoalteromonas rubra TaxID=43658 RepID=A0A8T0C604_9GAMM|nr:hypothetical protein PRUB_a0584 [Pseudoalteromonas rubra]